MNSGSHAPITSLSTLPSGEQWLALLTRQARLEYARVVYGLGDVEQHRTDTEAAQVVLQAQEGGLVITQERAEQRARAYLPREGQLHCPRCWVLWGVKNLLKNHAWVNEEGVATHVEVARCGHCKAMYVNPP